MKKQFVDKLGTTWTRQKNPVEVHHGQSRQNKSSNVPSLDRERYIRATCLIKQRWNRISYQLKTWRAPDLLLYHLGILYKTRSELCNVIFPLKKNWNVCVCLNCMGIV